MTDVEVFGLKIDFDAAGANKANDALDKLGKKLDQTANSADSANAHLKTASAGVGQVGTASDQAEGKLQRFYQSIVNLSRGLQVGNGLTSNFNSTLAALGTSGFGAVITGATGAVAALINFNLAQGRTATQSQEISRALGISVEAYQKLAIASDIVGVGHESLGELLRTFQRTVGNTGQSFDSYLTQLSKIPDANARISIATAQLGDVSQEGARIIVALTEANGQLGRQIDATGAVMDRVTISQLAEMDRRFQLLTLQVTTFGKKALLGLSDELAYLGLALAGDEEGLKRFAAEQERAAIASGKATGAIAGQTSAVNQLKAALDAVNATALKTGVDARLNEIVRNVSAGAPRALTKAEAQGVLSARYKQDPLLRDAIETSKILQQNQKLFNELVSPPSSTGGGARSTRAQLSGTKTEAERLREELGRINREIAFLRNPSSEEFQLTRQIINARAEAQRLNDALRGIIKFPELAKLNGDLVSAAGVPDLNNIPTPKSVRDAQAALAATGTPQAPGLLLSEQVSLRNAQLERDRARLQADIATGVTTELQAKREIVTLERRYASDITAIYEQQKQINGLSAEEIALLDEKIQRARQLGIELSPRAAVKAGLGDGALTNEEIYRDIGRGIRGSVRDGIYTGITEGGRAGLRALLDNLAGTFANAATEQLTNLLFDNVSLFKTPGFNPNTRGTASAGAASKAAGALGIGSDPTGMHVVSLDAKSTTIISLLQMIERNTALTKDLLLSTENRAISAAQTQPGIGQTILGIVGTFAGGLAGGLAGGIGGGGNRAANLAKYYGSSYSVGFGGGRATGGPVEPGIAYEWQEAGREFIIPRVPATVIPADKMPGSRPVNINITIQAKDVDSFRRSQPQITREMARAVRDAGRFE